MGCWLSFRLRSKVTRFAIRRTKLLRFIGARLRAPFFYHKSLHAVGIKCIVTQNLVQDLSIKMRILKQVQDDIMRNL